MRRRFRRGGDTRALLVPRTGRTLAAGVLLFVSVVFATSTIGAATADGVIFGTVSECPPGPIVYEPGKSAPHPTPVTITLRHDGRPFAHTAAVFATRAGWTGTFTFSVPAGRYEVLASSRGYRARWVNLVASTRHHVSFGFFACPL